MTRDACGGSEIEVAADVALNALQVGVPPGQRKADSVMIEVRWLPGARRVTLLAGLRDPERNMVGIVRLLKIWEMTSDASRGRSLILSTPVTCCAIQGCMHSSQSKARHF